MRSVPTVRVLEWFLAGVSTIDQVLVDIRAALALLACSCKLNLHAVNAVDTVNEQYQDEDEHDL